MQDEKVAIEECDAELEETVTSASECRKVAAKRQTTLDTYLFAGSREGRCHVAGSKEARKRTRRSITVTCTGESIFPFGVVQ